MPDEPQKSQADSPATQPGDGAATVPKPATPAENPSTEVKGAAEAAASAKKAIDAATNATPTESDTIGQNGSIQDNDSNRYINEEFARCPFTEEAVPFDNGQQYQINIFFAPKYLFDSEKNYFTAESYTFLSYNRNVREVVIEDRLARFGLSGHIDIINTGEHLNHILDRTNCYYLVVNFRLKEGDTAGIRFEPYIFDITSVANIVDDTGENKQVLRLEFVDMFTYIAMQHSMASILKYDPSISKKTSYREVFRVIMDYFKRFVTVNYNGLYSVKKDILFPTDNRGASANTSALVENSFRKMDPTCTILEGLEILLRDAGSPIRSSKGFKDRFNDFDYMLVPVFYREEYPDLYGIYRLVFDPPPDQVRKDPSAATSGMSSFLKGVVEKTAEITGGVMDILAGAGVSSAAGDKADIRRELKKTGTALGGGKLPKTQFTEEGRSFYENFNGTSDCIMLRPCSLRDIHMPFALCFTNGGNFIYESINPAKDGEGKLTEGELRFKCMNGRSELGIANYMYYPTNQNLVQKLWKNMILCNMGQQDGQASTVLIEFNWIYQYYIYNFLGYGTGNTDGYTSNITPSFYLAQQNKRITDSSVVADFSEMNANFQVIRSTSDLNEALVYIGKNLTSFVTQNDTYQFRIRGNIFRHPNEIIKVSNNRSLGANPAVSIHTDLANNDYILVYITSVKHTWRGSSYTNDISANKIYERLVNDTRTGV